MIKSFPTAPVGGRGDYLPAVARNNAAEGVDEERRSPTKVGGDFHHLSGHSPILSSADSQIQGNCHQDHRAGGQGHTVRLGWSANMGRFGLRGTAESERAEAAHPDWGAANLAGTIGM
jgi:hypothetical protein